MEYAVVLIHYKDSKTANESIRSILVQSKLPTVIYVVDNSANTDPFRADPDICEHLHVIAAPDNDGYGAAVNLVRDEVQIAGIEKLLVVTQDVILDPDASTHLLSASVLPVACVGPTLRLRSDPDQVFSSGGMLGFGGATRHARILGHADKSSSPVDWLDGAVLMLDVTALDSVGWFDEDYFLYYEEVDLCTKLRQIGFEIVVCQSANARQEPGNYTPYLRNRNHLLFWRKRFGGWKVIPAIGLQFTKSAVRSLLQKRPINIAWAARGIIDGCMSIGGRPPLTPWSSVRQQSPGGGAAGRNM